MFAGRTLSWLANVWQAAGNVIRPCDKLTVRIYNLSLHVYGCSNGSKRPLNEGSYPDLVTWALSSATRQQRRDSFSTQSRHATRQLS